ncbi:hypothetical protein CEQ90_17650 [Lewinellaceae bacterium SD302]|nr:hypothetical protein CEQ90_17650 [Lewinellaceae bacterium SD302]
MLAPPLPATDYSVNLSSFDCPDSLLQEMANKLSLTAEQKQAVLVLKASFLKNTNAVVKKVHLP